MIMGKNNVSAIAEAIRQMKCDECDNHINMGDYFYIINKTIPLENGINFRKKGVCRNCAIKHHNLTII